MPAPARGPPEPPSASSPHANVSSFSNRAPSAEVNARPSNFAPTPEEPGEDHEEEEPKPDGGESLQSATSKHKSKAGSMNRQFKFPSSAAPSAHPEREISSSPEKSTAKRPSSPVIAPSSIEVPPPPPVEKDLRSPQFGETEDDVGDTVDIPL